MITNKADFLNKDIFRLISSIAKEMGIRVFVVGDYVRDCFLGRDNNHINIVVEGNALDMGQRVADRLHKKVSIFKNFGVVSFSHEGDEIVISRAKKERFRRDGQNKIVEAGTIDEDLQLRDFTIDSLAFSLNLIDYGALVDPFGGIRDLSQGVIRTVTQPLSTFQENPLGMLRAVRLSVQLSTPALNFRIASICMDAMRKSADRIDSVTKERVIEELNKMLLCNVPGDAFYLLDEAGILQRLIPALSLTKGVETMDGRGHEDTFPHSLRVLDNIAKLETSHSSDTTNSLGIKQGDPNLWLRWAALLHDIGKPTSKRYVQGKGWTFYGYDVVGARMIPKVFSSLKLPLDNRMKYVQRLVSLQNRPKMLLETSSSESAFRRLLFDAGTDINDLLLLCEANITTRNKTKAAQELAELKSVRQKLQEVKEKDAINNFKNPISANYIMELYGLEPCNLLGILKNYIKDAILKGEIGNSFEEADLFLREKAGEMGLKLKEETSDVEMLSKPSSLPPEVSSTEAQYKESSIVTEEKSITNAEIESEDNLEVQEIIGEETHSAPVITEIVEPIPYSTDSQSFISEIIKLFDECGLSHLYLLISEDEFDSIGRNKALLKDYFTLFTHTITEEEHINSVISLEIDLRALTLPEVKLTFEELFMKGNAFCIEVSDIQFMKQNHAAQFYGTLNKNLNDLLSRCVFIVPKSIPIDYILNYKEINKKIAPSLPF